MKYYIFKKILNKNKLSFFFINFNKISMFGTIVMLLYLFLPFKTFKTNSTLNTKI
jgi:hypothetical protein